MKRTMWKLPDGRMLWVGMAFGKWMTFDSPPGQRGHHRFVSKSLPPRVAFEEAQADLDSWAMKEKLAEAA